MGAASASLLVFTDAGATACHRTPADAVVPGGTPGTSRYSVSAIVIDLLNIGMSAERVTDACAESALASTLELEVSAEEICAR
jgi:hypothetical protein